MKRHFIGKHKLITFRSKFTTEHSSGKAFQIEVCSFDHRVKELHTTNGSWKESNGKDIR